MIYFILSYNWIPNIILTSTVVCIVIPVISRPATLKAGHRPRALQKDYG